MIDLNMRHYKKILKLATSIKSLNVPMLLSWHDFKSTPSAEELSELLVSMTPVAGTTSELPWQIPKMIR